MLRTFSRAGALVSMVLMAVTAALAMPPAGMTQKLNTILKESTPPGASVGITVRSLDSDETWYARNAETPMMPASTTKVVTAALALDTLGPEYRFKTQLLTNGEIRDNVLYGDLYLRGGGDPSLRTADLRGLARTLATGDADRHIAPIHEVRGNLVLDDSYFPLSGPLRGPNWSVADLPWYYAAPSSALAVNGNAVNGRSVSDPARYTGDLMQNALRAQGLTPSAVTSGTIDPSHASVLAEHRSAPLASVLVPMMKRSDNQIAEQMHWAVLAETHRDARYQAVLDTFASKHGIDAQELRLVDGSGLSRTNRITPDALTGVLESMATSPHAEQFRKTLPVAGVDGTLRRRMTGTPATGHAYAKTGTIRGVSALAGYVDSGRNKHRLVFSILVNGHSDAAAARRLQDRIVNYLAGAPSDPPTNVRAITAKQPATVSHPAPVVVAQPARTTATLSTVDQLIVESMLRPQQQRIKTASASSTLAATPQHIYSLYQR